VLHAYYDALGNLVREDSLNGDFYCYYNAQGTSIQESVGGAVYSQEVWGLAYVNDLILRDWNSDGNTGTGSLGKSSSGLEDRQYAQHDKQFSVISLTSRTGSIHERMVYDPYGAVTVLSGSWVYASSGDDGTNYWAYYFQGMRELINGTSNVLITRNRLYDVTLGRWMAQDPAGYVDGANVYQMEVSNSLNRIDPSGRAAVVDPGRGGGSAGGYVHGGLVNGGVSVRTGNLVKDPGGLGNTFPGWIQLEFQQQGPGGSMGSTAECHWLQIITVQYTDSDGHQIDSEEMPPFAQDGLLHNAGVPYLDGDPFSSPLSPWYGGFTQDLQFITGELSIFDKPHPISGLGGYGLHYSFDDYLVCKNCTTGTFEVEKHVAWEYDSQADQYSGISIDNNFANPYLQQPNLNIGDGHAVPNPIEE
jgi:RHS repeat-associated protein